MHLLVLVGPLVQLLQGPCRKKDVHARQAGFVAANGDRFLASSSDQWMRGTRTNRADRARAWREARGRSDGGDAICTVTGHV